MKVKMVISGFVNLPISSSSSEKTLSTLTLPCPRFISHIEQFPFYNRIYFMVAWRSILFYLFTRSYVRYCTCSIWKTTNEIFFQLTYAHQCSVIKINWLRSNDLVTFLLSNKYFWSVSNFLTCACVKLSRVFYSMHNNHYCVLDWFFIRSAAATYWSKSMISELYTYAMSVDINWLRYLFAYNLNLRFKVYTWAVHVLCIGIKIWI